jgi:uncharacterized protein YpmB
MVGASLATFIFSLPARSTIDNLALRMVNWITNDLIFIVTVIISFVYAFKTYEKKKRSLKKECIQSQKHTD